MHHRLVVSLLTVALLLSVVSEAAVVELNPQNFKSIVENPKKNVFVMFYAPWCGHCHHMMPAWEDFGKKHDQNGNIVIARLDAATHRSTAAKYGIKGFPTLRLFTKSDKSGALEYNGNREVIDFQKFLHANAQR